MSIQLFSTSGVTAPNNAREPSANPPLENRLYTGPEARKLLRMRTEDFYAAIRTGELRAFVPGVRNVRVSQAAINEFIAAREGRVETETPAVAGAQHSSSLTGKGRAEFTARSG